jgi:uncharacterized cupredoxin-like copper-binding protein
MLKLSGVLLAFVALTGGVHGIAHGHGDKRHGSASAIKEQKDWGIAGDASTVSRTVDVSMGDNMRFMPEKLNVKQDETIRFRVKNTGSLLHEFVIGTKKENAKHAELMIKFPNMAHDEPYMAHVNPGETVEIIWTFNRAGQFEFACLIAGHFQAGMVGSLTVQANMPSVELADGEIRKINKNTGKITVKHGEIKSIEMPPMTMVFSVANKAMLEGLKEGDKIQFNVKQEGSNYIVTEIQKAQLH